MAGCGQIPVADPQRLSTDADIIMLLGKRGGAARNKRQIALAKEIQVIEWEKLSAELLKNALHTANLYAVKTENSRTSRCI